MAKSLDILESRVRELENMDPEIARQLLRDNHAILTHRPTCKGADMGLAIIEQLDNAEPKIRGVALELSSTAVTSFLDTFTQKNDEMVTFDTLGTTDPVLSNNYRIQITDVDEKNFDQLQEDRQDVMFYLSREQLPGVIVDFFLNN